MTAEDEFPGTTYATTAGSGSLTAAQILARILKINRWIGAAFPNNFLDVRQLMIDYGETSGDTGTFVGNAATAENSGNPWTDAECFDKGMVAGSLRSDGIHFNTTAGKQFVAEQIANFITTKGW